jgi:hypothetical protein
LRASKPETKKKKHFKKCFVFRSKHCGFKASNTWLEHQKKTLFFEGFEVPLETPSDVPFETPSDVPEREHQRAAVQETPNQRAAVP